jgi:hypothetical protein
MPSAAPRLWRSVFFIANNLTYGQEADIRITKEAAN